MPAPPSRRREDPAVRAPDRPGRGLHAHHKSFGAAPHVDDVIALQPHEQVTVEAVDAHRADGTEAIEWLSVFDDGPLLDVVKLARELGLATP